VRIRVSINEDSALKLCFKIETRAPSMSTAKRITFLGSESIPRMRVYTHFCSLVYLMINPRNEGSLLLRQISIGILIDDKEKLKQAHRAALSYLSLSLS